MILTLTNDFGTYRVRDPEPIDSAMFGPCLKGEYEWAPDVWVDGQFRCDRITSSQVELDLKTMKAA